MAAWIKSAWYLAAWSSELGRAPLGRRICGEELVLYRDAGGQVRALGARCPHRGASLARGTIVDGAIRCRFHGWSFAANGRCVDVPSQPASQRIPAAARVPAYPVVEQQGCIWIWPAWDCSPSELAPRYEFFEERAERGILRLPFKMTRSSFENVVENALDESHIPFTHGKTLGNDIRVSPRIEVEVDPDGRGITARWDPESPWGRETFERYGVLPGWSGRLLRARYGPFVHTARTWHYRFGGIVYFREKFARGGEAFVASAVTPADAETSWYAGSMSHPLLKSWLVPRMLVRRQARAITAEDVEATEALPRGPAQELLSVAADRAGARFRALHRAALQRERAAEPAARGRAGRRTPADSAIAHLNAPDSSLTDRSEDRIRPQKH